MGIEENKTLVREFFDAGDRGDMDKCLEMMSDNVTWTNIGTSRWSGTVKGKQALLDDLLGPLFSQLKAGIRSEIKRMIAEGDFVVVESRGQAETLAGEAYNNSYFHIFKVRNGLILEVTEYLDTALAESVLKE